MNKLLLLLLLLIPTTASAQLSYIVPSCNGNAVHDTAAFNAIKVTQGSVNPGTIKLPHKISPSLRCTVNNLTITSNLTLDNTDGSGIFVVSGQTLTPQGSIVSPGPIFYNVGAGLGIISVSGNKSQRTWQAAWWGPVGDGSTDDYAPLQAFLDTFANTSGYTLRFNPKTSYAVTQMLLLDHFMQGTVIGNDTEQGVADPTQKPTFVWKGADGEAAILKMVNFYGSTFRGFAFNSNGVGGSTHGADGALWFRQLVGGAPPIASQNTLEYNMVQRNSARAGWVGVRIDSDNAQNNEYWTINGNVITGDLAGNITCPQSCVPTATGTGILFGASEAFGTDISGNHFTGLNKGVSSTSTTRGRAVKNGFSHVNRLFEGWQGVIDGVDAEALLTVLYGLDGAPFDGQISNVHARDIKTDSGASVSVPVFRFAGGTNVTLSHSYFGYQDQTAPIGTQFFLNTDSNSSEITLNAVTIEGQGASPAPDTINVLAGLLTFKTRTISALKVAGLDIGFVHGGLDDLEGLNTAFQGITLSGAPRDMSAVQTKPPNDSSGTVANQHSIAFGDQGQFQIGGLAKPLRPFARSAGTNDGAQSLTLAVLARDVDGNRTMVSPFRTFAAHTTLSGTNKVTLTWPKVYGAVDYPLLQFSGGNWRIVATVTPSGTNIESYDIVANPSGSFSYVVPTYDETNRNKNRGPLNLVPATLANLSKPSPINGDTRFCSDCKNSLDDAVLVGSEAVGGGNGALVIYTNGKWRICN